jgi:predicted nucleic acid-binding Zn finger protein
MKIIKLKDKFKVESHTKGKFYIVDLNKLSCICPHFRFKLGGSGECKHIKAVKEKYSKKEIKITKKDRDILDYIKKKGAVDSMELINKFGDKSIDKLIKQGELLEQHGKIRVLD